MKLIGLTGGIASGKSAVTKILRQRGYPVINLDQIAREVVVPGSVGLERIVETFGAGYVNLDGTLDRRKLADLVFHDKEQLTQLDALMGPLLWAEVERQRKALQGDLVFLDAALLVEKGMHTKVDHVILVTAPEKVRVQRSMTRDRTTEDQVRARMRAQLSDDEKRKVADFVIANDGTLTDLCIRVTEVLEAIREPVR